MSGLIPAAEVIQPLIKTATHHLAFPVYIGIPNGCTLNLLPDDRMYPHVPAGATVIVDCTDREIQFGEYFLISQSNGPHVWEFIKPRRHSDQPVVGLRVAGWDPFRNCMGFWSDGDIYRDALEARIIGRVIGTWCP